MSRLQAERGRLLLDRPFTAEEAQAQDEAHQAAYVENRRQRFAATEADPSLRRRSRRRAR